MNWRGSRFGRAWNSVSKHGLKAGFQDVLARWGRSHLKMPLNVLDDYHWILHQDCPATRHAPASGPLTINWLLPAINITGSGGLFNICRTIQYLEHRGHKQRIYIMRKAGSGAR